MSTLYAHQSGMESGHENGALQNDRDVYSTMIRGLIGTVVTFVAILALVLQCAA